jgi:hypothetical protein
MRDARGSQGGWSPAGQRERLAGRARGGAYSRMDGPRSAGVRIRLAHAHAAAASRRRRIRDAHSPVAARGRRPACLPATPCGPNPKPMHARARVRPPAVSGARSPAGGCDGRARWGRVPVQMWRGGAESRCRCATGWAESRRRCGGEGALIGCMHEVGRKAAGGAAAFALPRSLHVVLL